MQQNAPSCHLKSAREAAPGHEAVAVVAGFRSGYALIEAEPPPSPPSSNFRADLATQNLQNIFIKTAVTSAMKLLQTKKSNKQINKLTRSR